MSVQGYGNDYDIIRAATERQLAEYDRMRASWKTCSELLRESQDREAGLRQKLAAAEKRAEEAEAKLRTLSGRVHGLGLAARNLAFATPDRTLRAELERCARLCAEAGEDAPAPPHEPATLHHGLTHDEHEAAKVRGDNGRIYCPTCEADDAEARRDGKMVMP